MLNSLVNSNKKPKRRVGRGDVTCGKGDKGQKSRSGGSIPVTFEGGQNPLIRCLPKKGFNSRKAKYTVSLPLSVVINLAEIAKVSEISLSLLKDSGLIKDKIKSVKIYNDIQSQDKIKLVFTDINVTKSISEKLGDA